MDTRLDHARCDVAHCLAPGLFRSLKKGERKNRKLDISYNFGNESLRFVGFEPLGADDLRVLQGIVALAGPYGILLSPVPSDETPKELRRLIATGHEAAGMDGLMVKVSLRSFLREIGLSGSGGNIRSLKSSLVRISNVNAVVSLNGKNRVASYNLLSFGLDMDGDGHLAVALNPRLAQAILGERSFSRIEMDEVRAIKSDLVRLIHGRLCGFVDPGKSHRVGLETLVLYAWPMDCPRSPVTKRKQSSRMRGAVKELAKLPGWHVDEYVRGKFLISRPSTKSF